LHFLKTGQVTKSRQRSQCEFAPERIRFTIDNACKEWTTYVPWHGFYRTQCALKDVVCTFYRTRAMCLRIVIACFPLTLAVIDNRHSIDGKSKFWISHHPHRDDKNGNYPRHNNCQSVIA